MSIPAHIPGGSGRLVEIEPADLAAYLKFKGWLETSRNEVRVLWNASQEAEEYEILLPASAAFKDYGIRVREALMTLEVFESRPWTSILSDIENFSADIVRIQVSGKDSAEGNIALEAGVKLFERTRELILAAACSSDTRSSP